MAAIDRMLCQAAEHFLYIGTEEIFMSVSYKKLWKLLIDKDMKKKDLVERYPVQYRDCKAQIAGLLVASEARRLGIDTQSSKLEQIMLQYLSNNDTLLSEDGIKTLNAYALKGYRLITDYPLFDKPTSREEFLDAFNVAMQFYEKKDS